MPHQINLQLHLKHPAPNHLETHIHGMIHRQLEHTELHLPEPERTSTQLHNNNQQPLSLRNIRTQHKTIHCTLELLHDPWAPTFTQALQPGTPFGTSSQGLYGTITQQHAQHWTLEQLCAHTQTLEPTTLELEFTTPTVFTHKQAHWDSPYPDLLIRSLEARWQHALGPALQPAAALLETIERVHYQIERGQVQIVGKRNRSHASLPAFMGSLRLGLIGDVQAKRDLVTLAAFAARVNAGKRVAYACGNVQAIACLEGGARVDLAELIASD